MAMEEVRKHLLGEGMLAKDQELVVISTLGHNNT
jgi:hypothetical protein